METMDSCVPPGFRFHPTDEELVGYYLKRKVASQRIDLDVIRDVDLYRIEPWDLQEKCRIGYEEQNEWYFFSHKDNKYLRGTRTNRATVAGFWKATGRDKAIYDKMKLMVIGMRKTLVFYKGRAPNGQKTDWIMHEYRLESDDENGRPPVPQDQGWVVCRAFKKRTSVLHSKAIESSLYNESSKNGLVGPTDCYGPYLDSMQQGHCSLPNGRGFFSTQETENTHARPLDHLVQLPQLECGSLSISMKKPARSGPPSRSEHEHGDHQQDGGNGMKDWRTLDKFVASQLMSQNININIEDHHEPVNADCGFGG